MAFLLPSVSFASVKEYDLKNGLRVLIIEDTKSPLATFQIWYRVGSRNEPLGKTGISHLLEHMMFKGTSKYASKEFSNIIQRNGGIDNAFTTRDYTMYFQTLASDRIDISLDLESDRISNLLLEPVEVVNERNVVMEERRMRYEDNPRNLLFEEVVAASFKAHSYRWPVIGWMADIESIEREDLHDYYRKFYSPDNAFIVVSGDVVADELIVKIRGKFEAIPSAIHGIQSGLNNRSISDIKKNITEEPLAVAEKRIYLTKDAELPYLLMAYHVPNFPHEDSYALEVLAALLSDGKSSRLYKNVVREKGLASSVFSDYLGFYKSPFLFFIGATAAIKKDISDVETEILKEIENIKTEPPSEREVQKVKNQIEASFIFAQDANYSRALYAGMFEMMGGWRLMDKYLEGIRMVTPADVQAAAKKYLNDVKTVGILIPAKKTKEEAGHAN